MSRSPKEDGGERPTPEQVLDGVTTPPILDADQAARFLRLASGNEALKAAREGRIPSVKFGKRRLFLRDQLLRFLEERSEDALDMDSPRY